MRKAFLILALGLLSLSANAGKVVCDSLRSEVLGAQVKFNVYLPDGFGKTQRKYPVIYLLHGLYGTYQDWASRGSLKAVADEFIASGELVPCVIIMPNAGHPDARNEWNGYFNMPGWNYEDFFFNELVPVAEARYDCVGDKGHRAVMGLSMGGGGSTVYAQRHPDMFSSCYAMSAWLDNETDAVKKPHAKGDKLQIVADSVAEHSAIKFVENADEATLASLRTVKWFFDCGDDDFLLELSEDIHNKMKDAKVKSELRVRDGVHNWEYWHTALRLALPFASRNFDK